MSTRYMKKLYGTNVLPEKDSENESDVDNPTINNNKAKTFNVFDMLNENSEHEKDKENEDQHTDNELCTEDAKRKKKKKRRRKVDSNKIEKPADQEDNESVDEIEKTVREVNKLLGEPVPSCSSQNPSTVQCVVQKSKLDILQVQHKHLNPYNELKRIFGKKTVEGENWNRGWSTDLKKTWLVKPKTNWVRVNQLGLYMVLDNTIECSEDIQYFMFEHSPFYRQVQAKFIEAVESLNPDNVADIVLHVRYHVDALLQAAELCKLGEDLPVAAEITQRALYALECAFHSLFNLTTARCRLDYRKQQNRGFFITLFKHLGMVAGRACYRTSLELCKLLLSLDPENDPLAMVLSIDYYALRAKEYEWFVEFINLWDSTRNLTQLPNIAYSLALAHFHLGNQTIADELLQVALIMFPGVLLPLLNKCSIQTDDKVIHHEFFTRKAQAATSPALEKLQALYIARSFNLWKDAGILPWLKNAVHESLKRVDQKDDYVKFCEVKRKQRYRGKLPRNILRHIILSDMKDVNVNVQEVQNDGLVLSYDPLPPLDSIDIYRAPTANTRSASTSSNLLSLFFSHMAE